MFKNVNLK